MRGYADKKCSRYWVSVTQLKHNRPDGKKGYDTGLSGWDSKWLLDSGTTGVYISDDRFDSFVADMGLTKGDPPDGFPLINCSRMADNGSIEIGFGQNSIRIPYSALIHKRSDTPGDCMMAIGPAGNSTDDGDNWNILGCKLCVLF
jgi:Eukaryotic aspartyl protease